MIAEVVAGVAVFAAVEAGLLWWRPPFYRSVAFPLSVEPLPIARAPEGSGRTATVAWEAMGDRAVFVAHGGGLPGLHGEVRFIRERRGVRLDVTWAPPWTAFAVCAAIALIGANFGMPWLSMPLSVAILISTLAAWQQAALRAAVELRFAWSAED